MIKRRRHFPPCSWRLGRGGFALALCGSLLAGSLAWGAGSAAAGQYTVWSCRDPEGQPISTAAWQTKANSAAPGDIAIADECASGGALRIEATYATKLTDRMPVGEATFRLPEGTSFADFELWRRLAADDGPGATGGDDNGAAVRERFEVFEENAGCPAFRGVPQCSHGTQAEPLAEANRVVPAVPPLQFPLSELGFWAGCVMPGCEPPATGPTAVFELFRSAVTIEDDEAPAVEGLEGSLAEAAPLSGVGHLFVTAADVGGGVAAFEFSADGGAPTRVTTANGRNGCEAPFSRPQPCPAEATRGFTLDTAGLAPGAHSISGAVVDAAGNSTPFGPVAFTVAPPAEPPRQEPPPAPEHGAAAATSEGRKPDNGTPAVEAPRLRVRAAGSGAPGRPARVRGALTTPEGAPIAGALLHVEVSELGARPGTGKLTVRSGADGRFAFPVRGEGAHTAVVSYSPIVGGPVSRSVHTVVKTPLSLRLRTQPRRIRNGQTVRFSGSLGGAGAAADGATVEIQAITDGGWTTVETVTVGADGRFRWTHRFRYVERDALFSFRAVVPRTPGWPWATVTSPRVKLPIKGVGR